jgi:hypothetical protein
MPDDIPRDAAQRVEEYLRVIMIADPVGARRHVDPALEIVFTGARPLRDPSECTAFNASRYRRVQKRFEGNRSVDRYTVRHGRIVRMEVWNASAELLLLRATAAAR